MTSSPPVKTLQEDEEEEREDEELPAIQTNDEYFIFH